MMMVVAILEKTVLIRDVVGDDDEDAHLDRVDPYVDERLRMDRVRCCERACVYGDGIV